MQRDLGRLSYDPKTLIPLYSGEGPNRFADFMQSRIRQNILSACYNDSLTAQQISLETGIPLPYLDDEIAQMESRGMLVRDGRHYKANVIVITAECQDEIDRAAVGYHEQIADMAERFLSEKIDDFISIGFVGSDFSENTLRWQLAAVLFRAIAFADPSGGDAPTPPGPRGASPRTCGASKSRSMPISIFFLTAASAAVTAMSCISSIISGAERAITAIFTETSDM